MALASPLDKDRVLPQSHSVVPQPSPVYPPRSASDVPRPELHLLGRCSVRSADGGEVDAILAQPKRLAMLAYLAMSGTSGSRTRDQLLAFFWPELDEATARHALRQSLYYLRRALGAEAVRSRGDFVELSADVWCDAAAFDETLVAGDYAGALKLYAGDLLDGFHAGDVSAEFDQWLEDARRRLRERAVDAALSAATMAERAGDLPEADRVLRRAGELVPLDERVLRRRLELLDRSGDRATALMVYEAFADRLRRELELEPSPETVTLVAGVRSRRPPNDRDLPAIARPVILDREQKPESTQHAMLPERRARPRVGAFITAALALAVVIFAVKSSARDVRPVLAVGSISDRTGEDSLRLGLTMRGLLSSELLRMQDVVVLSEGRVLELRPPGSDTAGEQHALAEAARRAGASDLIEGALYRLPGDSLRLDLRRVNLTTNVLRGAVSVLGHDPFTMASRAVETLGERMDRTVLPNAVAGVSTTSLAARRLYQEGLQAYYAHDFAGADRLFGAALGEDSTFAMAAYHASRVARQLDNGARRTELLRRAVRTAPHASDRERLLILAEWAEVRNDPSWRSVAETLAVRYPSEPDGDYALGRALMWSGDFIAARRLLLAAVRRDSAAIAARSRSPWCRGCDALSDAVIADLLADSLGSAERTARWWLSLDSASAGASDALAVVFERTGRLREALATRQRAWRDVSGGVDDAGYRVQLAIREGDFPTSDRIARDRAADSRPNVRREGLWWLSLSLRQQGRMEEAFAAERAHRHSVREQEGLAAALRSGAPEIQILVELGRFRAAVALGDSMVGAPSSDESKYDGAEWAGSVARYRAWAMVHLVEAVAASGDTARLQRLADSLEVIGSASAFGRDRRLHHHARGLLFLARHDTATAVREFRDAVHSVTQGYTRTNLVLGRLLTATGHARAAIAVLAPALRGDLQASNLYVTRTELHEALGDAYAAAGERAKARDAYRTVALAWAGADEPYRQRASRAARLAER